VLLVERLVCDCDVVTTSTRDMTAPSVSVEADVDHSKYSLITSCLARTSRENVGSIAVALRAETVEA